MAPKDKLLMVNKNKDAFTDFEALEYCKTKQCKAIIRRLSPDNKLIIEKGKYIEGEGWYSEDQERHLTPLEEPIYAGEI